MDPTQIAVLLDGILSTGAKPVAILSLLANVYLWRALRASDKMLMESRVEEIERMRGELDRLRNSDNHMLRQMDQMVRVVNETKRSGGSGARRMRSAHDED